MSIALVCLWVLLAALIGALPRRWHWRGAWVLIALGLPLLGYVTWDAGWIWGMIALAAGASVLRWPLIRLGRALRAAFRSLTGTSQSPTL